MLRRSASGALLMVLACVRSAATLLLRLVPLTALTALDLRPAGKSYRKTQWLPYDVLAGEAGPPLCIRGIVSLLPARLPGCVAAAFLSACVYSLSPSAAVLPLPLLRRLSQRMCVLVKSVSCRPPTPTPPSLPPPSPYLPRVVPLLLISCS
jgi:hypothetical protein